uniref:Uncharacterized protein n=2 Tax=Onchocerca TaxID=6281 RepID=A0A8R1XW15_ONCVO
MVTVAESRSSSRNICHSGGALRDELSKEDVSHPQSSDNHRRNCFIKHAEGTDGEDAHKQCRKLLLGLATSRTSMPSARATPAELQAEVLWDACI